MAKLTLGQVVFINYFLWQYAQMPWKEMNLWMRLPSHSNIVPLDPIVVDELDLAAGSGQASRIAYRVFQDKGRFEPWLRMSHHFTLPRHDRAANSNFLFEAACHYCLSDMVVRLVNDEPKTQDMETKLSARLELPAEKGPLGVFNRIDPHLP